MKKWLFPALLVMLLMAAVGCDQNDIPPSASPRRLTS